MGWKGTPGGEMLAAAPTAAGPPAGTISEEAPGPFGMLPWTSSSGTLRDIMARAASAPGGDAE
jgi:hypothetical protein